MGVPGVWLQSHCTDDHHDTFLGDREIVQGAAMRSPRYHIRCPEPYQDGALGTEPAVNPEHRSGSEPCSELGMSHEHSLERKAW